MLQAMFSGVSGLQVHQTRLNVIGNNIANVNTLGFKAGRVTFQDQLSQTLRASARPSASIGGQNPSQVGLGVSLGAVDTVQTQGNLQTTGKATDLAIQGNGFFMVSNGASVFYTRDGSFDLDSEGVMVNPASGLKLLGYVADTDGNIDTSQQVTSSSVIKVPVGSLTSVKQTTKSTFQGNLDAGAALQSTTVTLTGALDAGLSPGTITATVYDSLGSAHTIQLAYSDPQYAAAGFGGASPTGSTQRWTITPTIDGNVGTAMYLFNSSGTPPFVITDTSAGLNQLGTSMALNVGGTGDAPTFPISVDFSQLTNVSSVSAAANGQGGTTPIQSTLLTLNGNLNLDTLSGSPIVNTATVYDSSGAAYTVRTTLTNATTVLPITAGANVPEDASQKWDLLVEVDDGSGYVTSFDSASGDGSPVYYVPGTGLVLADGANPGNSLGSFVQLNAATIQTGNVNQGAQVASGFPLTIDLSKLTTTKTANVANGQAGASPIWNTSLQVFDGLGVKHLLNFKFTRSLVGTGAPATAAARWEWEATENGVSVANSASSGNNSLFFDNTGVFIQTGATTSQNVTITPISGAAPFVVKADFGTLTQLAGDSSVAATTQDGFPVGTLQSFSTSQEGLITGIFSNGQSRVLGQIATVTFSNPAGLEKLGQNLFKDSANSGLAQIGLPNLSGRGKISTGFVEMSNVDLSTEFTNLIVTQRGFQANTRIVTIVDDLLQDVINLKR